MRVKIRKRIVWVLSVMVYLCAVENVKALSDYTWNGSVSSDATLAANWTESTSSDSNVDYNIPANMPNTPVLALGSIIGYDPSEYSILRISAGAIFTIGEISAVNPIPGFNDVVITGSTFSAKGGQLVIAPKGVLLIYKQLEMTTNYASNSTATVTVQSDASAMGNLIMPNTVTLNGGTFNIQQNLHKSSNHHFAGWKYISIPFATYNVASTDLDYSSGKISEAYTWDEANYLWKYVNPYTSTNTLTRGKGAIVRPVGSDETITYSAKKAILYDSYTVALTMADEGYQLIGNPYVSGYRLNDQSANGLQSAVYEWNNASLNYDVLTVGSIISPLCGFFVKMTAANANFEFNSSNRTNSNSPLKSASLEANQAVFKIEAQNSTYDKVTLAFHTEGTDQYQPKFDALKMFGHESSPQAYWLEGEDKMTVNTVSDELGKEKSYALYMKAGSVGEFTLEAEDLSISARVFLHDVVLDKTIEIGAGESYTFTTTATDDAHRFNVVFKSAATGLNESLQNEVSIYAAQKSFFVKTNSATNQRVLIYDMSGKMVLSQELNQQNNEIQTQFKTGIYIVQVKGEGGLYTQKVILK